MRNQDCSFEQYQQIEKILDQITTKFSLFQQEIQNNKQYINETVEQIQQATITNQHYQTIDKLAAGLAHEIRNPLTTVGGFIQLLKPYLKEIGKEQYADIALDELKRANRIIYQFLNESKPAKETTKPISLNKLVEDLSILFESEAILKNVEIITNVSDVEIEIIGNEVQLKQVLVNLLKNAMEAIDAKKEQLPGWIRLHTRAYQNKALFVIEDNGCGMNDETKQNLFLPFHTTKEAGTGIGLSLCKKIIEDHNGSISVISTEGHGTIFQIDFPKIN
ncbi:ATP-binding protein [Pseudoneobacillus sp. C159]